MVIFSSRFSVPPVNVAVFPTAKFPFTFSVPAAMRYGALTVMFPVTVTVCPYLIQRPAAADRQVPANRRAPANDALLR
jgi:hypothetical protein